MELFARLIRGFAKWQFRARGLATIAGIPTEEFKQLLARLQADGWKKTYEYKGFDAWIDYGCVRLRHGGVRLKCEWDNWDEGGLEGPAAAIQQLAGEIGRPAVAQWRWAVWD